MKNIFVVPNPTKDVDFSVTKRVINILKNNGANVYMNQRYSESGITDCFYIDVLNDDVQLVIVIGGDGSFIDASIFAIEKNIPILGVNLGKVGYLSEVEVNDLSDMEKIFTNDYNIDEKMLLCVEITKDDGKEIICERLGVNDIVISHESHIGIADFVVYSNEGGIKYRADGVVFSTPAGSTAYSLSAGGPIVSHQADAIIVTPIAPHSFFNRSIVFGKNEQIKIKNTGDTPLNISVDGRTFSRIKSGERCSVFASEKKIKVMTFKENSMFSNLFGKMKIVEDII